MKFCPMCGEKIPSVTARFCNGCGLNLGEYRKKLERLAITASVEDKPSRAVSVPKKNPPPRPAAATVDDLSADELLERGIFADKSGSFGGAVRYYERAIRLGNSDAMIRLGGLYERGQGVKADDSKALELYLRAAKAGNTQALLQAAIYFDENKNVDKAKEIFSAAEKAGDAEAALALGYIYFRENNFSQARPLLEKAAAFNLYRAFYFLGELYENGNGVPKNMSKALQFYYRANPSFDRTAVKNGSWNAETEQYEIQLGTHILSFKKGIDDLVDFMSPFLNKFFDLFLKFQACSNAKKLSYGQELLEELAEEGIKIYARLGHYGVSAKDIVHDDGRHIFGLDDDTRKIFLSTPPPADILRKGTDDEIFLGAVQIVQDRFLVLLDFGFFVFTEDEARKMLGSLDPIHMPEEKFRETLINSLLKNPFNMAAYEIYLNRYGDENGELKTFAVFFGMERALTQSKQHLFLERIRKLSRRFTLFPNDKFGEGVHRKGFLDHKVPNLADLKRDYRIIDAEALKIQLDIYGKDDISFIAAAYRMLIKAFEDEKNSKGDSKRIPAFKYVGESDLGDLVIPEGIETIGAFAFAGTWIHSIKFPLTLKKIEAGAFYGCCIFSEKLVIPEGVEEISINMLGHTHCPWVCLPKSIKRVSGEPNCMDTFLAKESNSRDAESGTSDESDILQAGLKMLAADFNKQTKFHFDYDRAEVLAEYFSQNGLLKHTTVFTLDKLNAQKPNSSYVVIGEDNILIEQVFNDEAAYKKIFGGHPFGVIISETAKTEPIIGYRAFADSHVVEIKIPDNLKVIRDEAFCNCQDLENVTLPRSVEKLGSRAFMDCANLEYVIIPETLRNIGDDILKNCPAVIYCDGSSFAAEYCRKNNLPMEDYGAAKFQEAKQLMASAQNEKENEQAVKCLDLAAYVGNIEACFEMGKYQVGRKVFHTAEIYFKRAAELGHKASMFKLYKIYRDGEYLVEKNPTEAEKWLALSGYDPSAGDGDTGDTVTVVTNYAERMRFIEGLFKRFQDMRCLYFAKHGEKSYTKIARALSAYGNGEREANVICVFDNTLMGGAEDGFFVTDKKFYAHNAFESKPIEIPLEQIQTILAAGGQLFINGTVKVAIFSGGKSAEERIPVLLNEIKRAFVR